MCDESDDVISRQDMGYEHPVPSAGSERCPTCSSNNRSVRGQGLVVNGKWVPYHNTFQECPDPWHSSESGKEGETNVANTDVRGRSESGRSSADLLVNRISEPLTPAPAQGEELSASRLWLDTYGESARGSVSWSFACTFAEAYAAHVTAVKDAEINQLKAELRTLKRLYEIDREASRDQS